MGQSYFIWNGADCRSMGVISQGAAPIIRPEERVEHIEIPGRSGDLTQTEGEAVYNSYIQTVSIAVIGGYRVREVYRWLRGSGWLTLSGEPDRRQPARIIGAITLNKHSRRMDAWEGEVQFYCQPLKEKLKETSETFTDGGVIRNSGDVTAKPRITLTGNQAGSYLIVAIGGKQIDIDLRDRADTGCIVDCETMMITDLSGTTNLTALAVGDFPTLSPGDNSIGLGENVASAVIEKRERFL